MHFLSLTRDSRFLLSMYQYQEHIEKKRIQNLVLTVYYMGERHPYLTRVTRKQTRSVIRIGQYMNCHGESTLQVINKRVHFLNSCRISGYFYTKFTTIAQIEQILQESKDPKIYNILNLERVYFLVTRVTYQTCIIDRNVNQ